MAILVSDQKLSRTYLEKLLKLDPDDMETIYDLAFIYADEGKTKEAIEMFSNRLNELPELNEGQPSDGREELYNGRGGVYYYLGEYEKAFQDMHKAIELNPSRISTAGDTATFYEKAGKTEEARNAAMIVLSKFPRPKTSIQHQHYGTSYRILGEYDKAIKFLTKGIELNPDDMIIVYERALSYLKSGNKEAARKDLIKIIDNNSPDKAEAEKLLKTIGND